MKKIYTIVAVFAVALSANAQKGVSDVSVNKYNKGLVKHTIQNSGRAAGDTLMYMPLPGYFVNATDQANFDIVTQDIDQLVTNNAGYAMDFIIHGKLQLQQELIQHSFGQHHLGLIQQVRQIIG